MVRIKVKEFSTVEFQRVKQGPHIFPQAFAAAFSLQHSVERLAGELLGLADQKGQHHQHGEDDGKMSFAMAKVMFKVVAFGRIAFTIVSGLPILFADWLRCQGNGLRMIGMHNRSP